MKHSNSAAVSSGKGGGADCRPPGIPLELTSERVPRCICIGTVSVSSSYFSPPEARDHYAARFLKLNAPGLIQHAR